MKTLLRTCALAAALVLSAFATTHHAAAAVSGTCSVICYKPNATPALLTVNTVTTDTQCCSSSYNPCPAGYSLVSRSFAPSGSSSPQRCLVEP